MFSLQVSLASAISTASSAAGAYVSSKVCSRFGRNIPVASGFLIDSAFYICCLLWQRSTFQTMNVVYALFVARGALDGTWKLIANGKNFKPVDRNGWPDFQAQFTSDFAKKSLPFYQI